MSDCGSPAISPAPAGIVMRWLRRLCAAALALAFFAPLTVLAEKPPRRVVSMNVCTDQLAMLLAAPGQLLSVSFLASDPGSSALAAQAPRYRPNHGLAEEIFLMEPDLVITGTYTTQVAVSMLERLGFRVEKFAFETSFDDVRKNIRRMGALLGQEQRADDMVETLDAGLQQLAANAVAELTVATYASNSYTTGRNSLSEAVIEAAGLSNLGSEVGIEGSGRLPLEVLVLAMPQIVTSDTPTYDAPALAQENFVHPAYQAVLERARTASVPAANWICGGPFNLVAAQILHDAAHAVAAQREPTDK